MANFQARDASVRSLATQYSGGAAINTGVTATDYTTGTGFAQTTNTEFVFGFEARAQAAYQVTKGFSIRGGLDAIDFAQGIWRAANPGFGNINANNQDVQLAGYTFGLEYNR